MRALSVEAWHHLAGEGANIPVKMQLDGDSMSPLIRRRRDVVTIVPLRRPPKAGDIVLFADHRGRYVVHRVWKVQNGKVVTLGDHCTRSDPPLEDSQIWGLVTSVSRDGNVFRLDNAPSRLLGRIWMTLLPVRSIYYKIRNRGNQNGI